MVRRRSKKLNPPESAAAANVEALPLVESDNGEEGFEMPETVAIDDILDGLGAEDGDEPEPFDADDITMDEPAMSENPLDMLAPEISEDAPVPAPRKAKVAVAKTVLAGGGEVKVSIKPPAPVPVPQEPVAAKEAPKKRRSALDLLAAGTNETFFVTRTGPKQWRGKAMQVADCGYIPGDVADIHQTIKDKWGGGSYRVKGRDSEGEIRDLPVKIAGRPLPIDEESAAEEEEERYEEEEREMDPRWGGHPYAREQYMRRSMGEPGYPVYGAHQGARLQEQEEEKRELQERLQKIEGDSRQRERDMMLANQQRSESFLGEFMKMQVMGHQADQQRWEREFRERQLQQEKEQQQREQQWQEQQQRWEREQAERAREREERDRLQRDQMGEERRRLEAEQKRWEQQRREDLGRQTSEGKQERERHEQHIREQREFYERLSKIQDANNGSSSKVLDTVRGFLDIAHQAREMVTDQEDPKVAQIKAVQEAVSAGLSAAKPVVAAFRGQQAAAEEGAGERAPSQLAASQPQEAPRIVSYPTQDPAAAGAVPPGMTQVTVPTQVLDEAKQKLTQLVALLRSFSIAIKGREGKSDPPEWSMGRLQDMPDILEELRAVETPEALVLQLEVIQTGGNLEPDVEAALTEFVETARTDAGKEWLGSLLAKIGRS
jgi:hypothetical protein